MPHNNIISWSNENCIAELNSSNYLSSTHIENSAKKLQRCLNTTTQSQEDIEVVLGICGKFKVKPRMFTYI